MIDTRENAVVTRRHTTLSTTLGHLLAVAEDLDGQDALIGLYFHAHWHPPADGTIGHHVPPTGDRLFTTLAGELAAYLSGSLTTFTTPVRTHGDVEDRLYLRASEVRESFLLIQQVLQKLPEIPGLVRVELAPAQGGGTAFGWSESARGANFHWVMLDANQKIYRCFIRSASYPNWPALAVAAPGNIIPDFPLINKSFELCYACLDR